MSQNPPAPEPRTYRPRLPEEAREMKPGESLLLRQKAALCVLAFGRRQGWVMVRRVEGDSVRVWRHS